jgi:signal transduction histidine kinase
LQPQGFPRPWFGRSLEPRSIRYELAGVFLIFFLLVRVLGAFSVWRLSNFNRLSADVSEIWLPTTRALGDLNNYTSDFRAIEGSNLLAEDRFEAAVTEQQMAELDRSIADAEREYEQIWHDAAESALYQQFTARWMQYRAIVNQMLVLSRSNRKAEAIAIYSGGSRLAYNAASDTLGQLTDQAVASAALASQRLGAAYRQAVWLIVLAMAIAAVMVIAALLHISRAISAPLLQLADRMRRLAARETDVDIPATERRDEIGEMAKAAVVFRNNALDLIESQRTLARQAAMLAEQLAHEQRLALLQRNFVSMASHEFRTPLTIIDGQAGRMVKRKETITGSEVGERAGKFRSAVLRMTHLIDNLLNSSRLIDGGVGQYFHPMDIDLAVLLRDVCQLYREMAPGAQIIESIAAAPIRIADDPKLLSQVFSNLLSNAIKYSPGGGTIAWMPPWPAARSSWPSPITASAFRLAISTGCLSDITAAATSPGSSVPGSASTWSRWLSTCTAGASRWRVGKRRVRASPYPSRCSPLERSSGTNRCNFDVDPGRGRLPIRLPRRNLLWRRRTAEGTHADGQIFSVCFLGLIRGGTGCSSDADDCR